MLGGLIRNLCIEKPLDPIQYCIDSIAFSADYAKQVSQLLGLVTCMDGKLTNSRHHLPCIGHGTWATSCTHHRLVII